ncbi:MAG: condensation domain-containing protein, partial [Myxococcota bacterium]
MPLRTLFARPTIAQLAEFIAADKAQSPLAAPPLEPAPRDRALPLSFAQQRLWFIDRFESAGAAYNISITLHIRGALDVDALRWSFQQLIDRHETLRTHFVDEQGQPAQVITEHLERPIPLVELGDLAEERRRERVHELIAEEARQPFILTAGPLIRARLLRLDTTRPQRPALDHLLLLSMHHIVSDGWSMAVLTRELDTFYRARCSGRAADLPALPVQYVDFASWQRSWLRDDALQTLRSYWQTTLDGIQHLELPLDFARPSTYSYHGAHHRFELDQATYEHLTALGKSCNATLFTVLLAGFKLLLQRYCGQNDIAIGTPVANRQRRELEGIIGFFANTLVLRTHLGSTHNQSFRDAIERVKQVTVEAHAHQALPFEQVVGAVAPERDTSRAPLFQVTFAFDQAPLDNISLGDATLSVRPPDHHIAKFDLSLTLYEREGSLRGSWVFNTSLFKYPTIAQMASHYRELMAILSAHPDRPIATLPMLRSYEQDRLSRYYNDTATPYPQCCIHQQFASQVALRPDAIAARSSSHSLSYAELDRRA